MEVLAAIIGLLAAYGLFRLVRRIKPNSDAITQFDQTSPRSGEKASTFQPVSWQSRGKAHKSQESPHSDAITQRCPVSSNSGEVESAIEPVSGQSTGKSAKSQELPHSDATGQGDPVSSNSGEAEPAIEPVSGHSTGRAAKSQKSPRWIPPGGTATVAGRDIGGMLYLGRRARREGLAGEGKTFIDSNLSVAELGSDISGESLPYWPNYSDISPPARATYLDWLASGRADNQYGVGYVFLYFYGIERRFFVDSSSEEEKRVLIAEAERLLGVYGENRSVRRYLGAFLDAGQIVVGPLEEVGSHYFEKSGYELPLGLRASIGRMTKEEVPLSADWLLSWYISHPEYQLRTPATRAFLEFRSLFALLYYERFPEGLKVSMPKRLLRPRYTAASGEFEIPSLPT